MKSSFNAGGKAAFEATGGSSTMGSIGGDAAGDGAASSGSAGAGGPPAWAQRMRRSQHMTHAVQATAHAVRSGDAHAALVLDADGVAQGWAQYGSPEELDGINHRREYDKAPPPRPDWRITCVFVDKRHRGQGVARAAVRGALDLVREAGGGTVEAISEVTDGRTAQSRFLLSGTVEMLEDLGFERGPQVGKHAVVMTTRV